MLTRVLEPELMDSEEDAREYDAMDHCEVNRQFVCDFLAVHGGGWRILDVGTGTAQIPIELCMQEKRAVVVALDAAEHMLRRAAENVAAAGLAWRIHLKRCDAKSLPFQDGSFGAVISNSIVHHIEYPSKVMAELHRVVQPGGTLFVRDLLRPDDQAAVGRLVSRYAGGATEVQRSLFAASLHAALALNEVQEIVRELGLAPEGVRQTSDRHWTWTLRRAMP
jgi:ubiquinone/menaquinone biosynthesis C-methylase UbiE